MQCRIWEFLFCTGIGRATVKALVQCGAEVIALSRTETDLESLKQEVNRIYTLSVNNGGNNVLFCVGL